MAARDAFEYLVLMTQSGRATFANGQWLGPVPLDQAAKDPNALNDCPLVYEYLPVLGADGWELVTTVPVGTAGEGLQFFFKRKA
jgi:hypothetical protein